MRVLVVSSLFEPLLSTVYTSRFVQTVIVCLLAVGPVWATVDTCAPCVFPCKRSEQETFTIRLRGGRPDPAYAYSSVVRDTLHLGNEIFQALRFHRRVADSCSDTVIIASHVSDVVLGRTLGKVPPLYVPIHPVPEYQVTRIPDRPTSFLEIGPWVGYAGADSSVVPRIGFNNAFGGIEALIAPFGSLLGEKLQLGIGGGALFEGGRMRIPLMAHLRYTFSTPSTQEAVAYVPGPCTFDCGRPQSALSLPQDAERISLPGPEVVDSTAALIRTTEVVLPTFAPYLFAETAYVFNGNFEGRGREPSVNADEYGQYMMSMGVGIPVIWRIHAQLAYRYARLNLRTPCESCNELFIVNTNSVHAVMLRLVLHWGW